jgi:hypothetical protein
VLDQVPRNTGHVSGFPREHAYVVPPKLDECVFLFMIQVGLDKGRLAGIVVDQLNLLVLVGLDVLPWCLVLWDLQLAGGNLGGVDQGLLHVNRVVGGLCHLKAFLFTGIGSVNIASESKDALLGRHFEHQVRVVWHSHELGERWSTKDGVVPSKSMTTKLT